MQKLVKESVDEVLEDNRKQFQKGQTPYKSLGVGMDAQIDAFLKGQGIVTTIAEEPAIALGLCATKNKIKFVDYLLDLGVDIHGEGEHPLRVCAWHGKYEMAIYLIKRGANLQKAIEESTKNMETGTVRNLDYIKSLLPNES